jgi:hypothetical protein
MLEIFCTIFCLPLLHIINLTQLLSKFNNSAQSLKLVLTSLVSILNRLVIIWSELTRKVWSVVVILKLRKCWKKFQKGQLFCSELWNHSKLDSVRPQAHRHPRGQGGKGREGTCFLWIKKSSNSKARRVFKFFQKSSWRLSKICKTVRFGLLQWLGFYLFQIWLMLVISKSVKYNFFLIKCSFFMSR